MDMGGREERDGEEELKIEKEERIRINKEY